MKRRSFCASAVSVLTTTAVPWLRAGELPVSSSSGSQMMLKPSDIDDLRAGLRGEVLVPGQQGYETARRVWNGAFDRRPAMIVRCAGAADVSRGISFARSHELLMAVRGGGHSLSGQSVCDGGLVIDLSPMKSIRVDPAGKRARVEPGVLLGGLDRETQAFGLVTPAGTVSHTGAAGLTLGGGFGRLARKHGLACDNLVAADLVTADGLLVKTDAGNNPDLLWGLRGGGGNFGVVTSFEYQLHPLSAAVQGGHLAFPFAQARTLLRSFADFIASASDELYAEVVIPPAPEDRRVVVMDVCHCGAPQAAERELAQLRKLGKPLEDGLRAVSYVDLQRSGDQNYPAGRGYYVKSGFLPRITPQVIDTSLDYLESAPSPANALLFVHHGGAIERVKPEATAFWHREANHSILLVGFWDEASGMQPATQWVRSGWKSVEALTDGFYVNLYGDESVPDESARRVQATYGGNYKRLAALKKRYDPANLFRMNANVKPA